MPQQPNAVRAGAPVVRKIPTGKQVAKPQPEPEPEPEVYTLDQLLIAQIIEGINNIAYNFPEGDPRLVRLFQAKICLIDYAGLEILTRIEEDAAKRQAQIMAQIQGQREGQPAHQPSPQPSPSPRRRSRAAEEVEAEFKTTGEVVKNLVSAEGDGEMQPDVGEMEPGAEMPDEGGAGEVAAEGGEIAEGGELPGDEGPMDPYEQDVLENPDAPLPGLEGIPHLGGQKKLPQAEGPVTQESKNLVARILERRKDTMPQAITSPPAAPAKQPPKGKQQPPKKEQIDSVG